MSTRQKLESKAYEPKEWENVNCPVCDSDRWRLHERFGDRWQYAYVLCLDCRLVYLNPRPLYDADFIHDAYEYYAENDDRYENTIGFLESTLPDARKEVEEIRTYDTEGLRFLDVGCAMGNTLYGAKHSYPEVFGLEVSGRMAGFVERTVGAKVFTVPFEQLSTDLRFSCIYMSHVIEHIPNPNDWLRKATSLLTEQGIVVLNVPNMFSLDRKVKLFLKRIGLRKGNWESWRTPDHLYEPTIPGMMRLFERTGFKVLNHYTYSRKDIVAGSRWGRFYHRRLLQGSNLRFYIAPVR